MGIQKQKPPDGWSEEEWRLYQEGMAAKKEAEAANERPAAEIVGDLMEGIPGHTEELEFRHYGPWVKVSHREKGPDPVVEWFRRLFRRKSKG